MKTACLLFVGVSFGLWTFGLRAEGDPPRQPAEQEVRGQRPGSVHPAEPDRGGGTQVNRPRSLLNNSGHLPQRITPSGPLMLPKHTSAAELHPSVAKKTPAAPSPRLMVNKTAIHSEPAAKLPIGSGNVPARAEVVRARSTATAALGGRATVSAKNSTAVLDGAAMKRKPL